MIHSMTAYARHEVKGAWGSAVWELRSVNQRYLESYLRLPEQFRSLEPVLRDKLRKRLARGKVECSLRFEKAAAGGDQLLLNEELAGLLAKSAQKVANMCRESAPVNPLDILRWPGVMAADEADLSSLQSELMAGFEQSLSDFIDARAREGENMKAMIEQRLDGITEQAAQVKQRMPEVIQWQRDKLQGRLDDIQGELDPSRVEQELVLQAQKLDVAEELDRLDSHVSETRKVLNKGGACGRRLDFMMQEFNREANTLASKSICSEITASAVELKVLIEQMREQIQNIE